MTWPAAGATAREEIARDMRVGWSLQLPDRRWATIAAIMSGDARMPRPLKSRLRIWVDCGDHAEAVFMAPGEKAMIAVPPNT